MAADAGTVTVKVVPEIDEEALRNAVIDAIAGHAVVKPGETLVIRARDMSPGQASYYQGYLDARHHDLPFRTLVVTGDEMAVAAAGDAGPLTVRLPGSMAAEGQQVYYSLDHSWRTVFPGLDARLGEVTLRDGMPTEAAVLFRVTPGDGQQQG